MEIDTANWQFDVFYKDYRTFQRFVLSVIAEASKRSFRLNKRYKVFLQILK